MTTPLLHVQPGDLIRAELINGLLDELAALDARVTVLEAGPHPTPTPGGALIANVSPSTVRVGELLTVTGQNFGWTTGSTVVTLDGQPITELASGSNQTLVFPVPELIVPSGGREVQLVVSNGTTSDSRNITVVPRGVPLEGDLELTYVGTTPATPTPGATFLVEYRLTSRATQDLAVTLTPQLSTGWTPVRVLTDASLPVPITAPVTIQPRHDVSFLVEVPVPNSAATGTGFTLDVAASGGGLTTPPAPRPFTVGSAAEQQADYIDLSAPDGTSIAVARGTQDVRTLECEFSQTGNFNLSLRFPAGAFGWQVDTSDVPTPIVVTAIPPGQPRPGWVSRSFSLGLTAPSALPGAQPTQLYIDVQKQGETIKRSLLLKLTAT
jgi:IPT/TIG domain